MVVFSYILMTLLMFSGLFLIGLVLLQRGRGGGLAGAFGGMGGQSAFGTKAGDVFTRITIGVATAWILLCAGSVVALHHASGGRTPESSFKTEEPKDGAKDSEVKAAPKDDAAIGVDPNTPPPAAPQGGTKPASEKKADEKPAEGQKPADAAPAKPEDAKPETAPAEEKKAEEKPVEPPKAEEPKPAEEAKKPAEPAPEPAPEKKPE